MIINNKINHSPTLVFAEAAKKRKNEGKDIISMGIGEPDFSTPDFIIDAIIENSKDKTKNGYLNALGLPQLRDYIAQDLAKRKSTTFTSNQIMITSGAKQALQLVLFSILQPGDEVLCFTPCYVSYEPQILLAEPQSIPVPINLSKEFTIDIDQLESKINKNTKAIILNSPHNPTGKVLDKKTLLEIADLVIKHNLYLILDDVYELLMYKDKDSQFSLASIKELENQVFLINSFSKSHAIMGWRIGYLCAPKHIMSTLVKIQQHMQTNVSSILQYACMSIFENGYDFLIPYKDKLKNRSEYIYQALQPSLRKNLVRPEGGFFYFFDISDFALGSNQFCSDLIEKTGVAMTPGIAFGEDWDGYVRLSFGVKDDELKEGIRRLLGYIKQINPNT